MSESTSLNELLLSSGLAQALESAGFHRNWGDVPKDLAESVALFDSCDLRFKVTRDMYRDVYFECAPPSTSRSAKEYAADWHSFDRVVKTTQNQLTADDNLVDTLRRPRDQMWPHHELNKMRTAFISENIPSVINAFKPERIS